MSSEIDYQAEIEPTETAIHDGATNSIREATIGSVNGSATGAALYLTATELRELGATLDDGCVTFRVTDGQLMIE